MQRTQRLTLLSALTAAALAGVAATAGAQQEPYPQKPTSPPVETGAVDSSKMQPGQTNPAVTPSTGAVTTKDTLADTSRAKKGKKAKPAETPDTTKPKN